MTRIAIPLADGYEDSEFRQPYETLRQHGHQPTVVGRRAGVTVTGKRGRDTQVTEVEASRVRPGTYDALVIPGGHSPDELRLDAAVVSLVADLVQSHKPVASICHGASLLVEADVLKGRTLTSWPSVRKDVENAGARWVDEPLVRDGNLISSRAPGDLEDFCVALLDSVGARAA